MIDGKKHYQWTFEQEKKTPQILIARLKIDFPPLASSD